MAIALMAVEPFIALAPHSDSPSPHSEESYPIDDNFGPDDLDGSGSAEGLEDAEGGGPKRRSRRPPSTAERRATHNAVERARRETLNGRFMELASALPSMAQVKRPSKSIIVAKSLDFVYGVQARENALMAQNAALRREVDELRARLGMSALPAAAALPAASNTAAHSRRELTSVSSAGGPVDESSSKRSPSLSTVGFDLGTPSMSQRSGSQPVSNYSGMNMNGFVRQGPSPSLSDVPLGGAKPMSNEANSMLGVNAGYNGCVNPAVPSFPGIDINYLMALSMQQQHEIAAMALPRGQAYGPATNWASFGMNLNHAPISAGGDLPGSFLFA